MSLQLVYRKLGCESVLRIDDPALEPWGRLLQSAARIAERPCSPEAAADLSWSRAAEGGWRIQVAGEPWSGTIATPERLYLQSDQLLDDFARAEGGEAVFLHAGAVVTPGGAGILISGHPGAGKTSLVTSCLLEGWQWLSDELLRFRPDDWFWMEGSKRNFNLKQRSFETLPMIADLADTIEMASDDWRQRLRFFNPDSLRPGRHCNGARVAALVFPGYDPGAVEPRLERCSESEVAGLLASEVMTSARPAFAWLAALARGVPGYRLAYRRARDAVALLEQTTGRSCGRS